MEPDQYATLPGLKFCHFSKNYGYFAREKKRQNLNLNP
jgi:hypothetical protein